MSSMDQTERGMIAWFANNPVAANLLMVGLIVLGLLSLGSLRKEAFPSMEPNHVTISAVYDSGDAHLAEEGIALKIENALETVPGIKRVTSVSNASGSRVTVERESDYDLDRLLQDIKSEVDAINNFPTDAEKPVIAQARRQDHALWVQLSGETDRATLQTLLERLKEDLLAKPDIREVVLAGKAEPMVAIDIDAARLQSYGLGLSDVADAIKAESGSALTTSLRNSEQVVRLKAAQQAYRAADFARIPLLTTADGGRVLLGDVASVVDTYEDAPQVISRYNGVPGAAVRVVMDERGDITSIVEQAEAVVADWQARGALPAGVELETWYDKSTMIKERLSLLTKNAFTGILLVFVILAIFLNVQVALWVAAGLPFVFFGTLFLMTDDLAGLTINQMTTFGFIMALGIVVDDAVVVGESIYSTRQQHGDHLRNTILGTHRVAVPTLFGVLTTVATFAALTQVEGNMGQIYAQFASVVAICLLLSVVESKLILPAHLSKLNTQPRQVATDWRRHWDTVQTVASNGLQAFNDKLYTPTLQRVIRYRYGVVLGFTALLLLVIGMPLNGTVKTTFFPDIPGDVVNAKMVLQQDASFGQNAVNLERLETSAYQADLNLRTQANGDSPSGIASLQVDANADTSGIIRIELAKDAPYSSRDFTREWQRLAGSPEGVKQLQFVSQMQMVDSFKVEIKAWDQETVSAAGAQVKAILRETAGVSGIDDNLDPSRPQMRFSLTPQGQALGMTTAQLSRQVLQAFGGEVVQRFQRDKDEVKVRVRYPLEQRQTRFDVEQARVRLPDGTSVALRTVADIHMENQREEITRIDGKRGGYISADVDKAVLSPEALVTQLKRDLEPQLARQFPGIALHFAGEAEQQAETTSSMSTVFFGALLAVYALLAIPLRSYGQPLLIMSVIPFGIVGAILGHWLNGLAISILSLNGILALSGVVVNDSLLLVSRFNELTRSGQETISAIFEAAQSRLRAVLLTSVTTFAGLMPLLSETSLQAQFLKPAAASLGYGILFATLITLLLIPALLAIGGDLRALLKRGRNSNANVDGQTAALPQYLAQPPSQ